jgi:hypothetical protein
LHPGDHVEGHVEGVAIVRLTVGETINSAGYRGGPLV